MTAIKRSAKRSLRRLVYFASIFIGLSFLFQNCSRQQEVIELQAYQTDAPELE